jgi:predicted amidohydrolase
MLKGAEIILTPNAGHEDENRVQQFKSRAFENMLGVAMANYAAPQCNGHSCAFDGMVRNINGTDRNPLVIEVGGQEGVFLASFNLNELREYRKREIWGNAYRKPQCYDLLASKNDD